MAGETIITVVGNLTEDPTLAFTPSGVARCSFTVASTPRSFDKQTNEWKDGSTLFLPCTIWRQPAEHAAESLQRGLRVIVQGRLISRSFETKEGQKRTVLEMDVEEVGPSLRNATAKVEKATRAGFQPDRSGGQQQSQGGWGQQAAAGDPWASQPAGQGAQGGGWGGAEEPPF